MRRQGREFLCRTDRHHNSVAYCERRDLIWLRVLRLTPRPNAAIGEEYINRRWHCAVGHCFLLLRSALDVKWDRTLQFLLPVQIRRLTLSSGTARMGHVGAHPTRAKRSAMKQSERPVIAVLGMGKMGQALAGRLLDQAWPLRLWNRSPREVAHFESRGAVRHDALDTVWEHAQIVITFLENDDALASVCLGNGGLLQPGSDGRVLIDMSTVSPGISRDIAARASQVGVAYLRSPVSGNPQVLAAGAITLLVSGPRETFKQMEELLQSIGPTVLYLGEEE